MFHAISVGSSSSLSCAEELCDMSHCLHLPKPPILGSPASKSLVAVHQLTLSTPGFWISLVPLEFAHPDYTRPTSHLPITSKSPICEDHVEVTHMGGSHNLVPLAYLYRKPHTVKLVQGGNLLNVDKFYSPSQKNRHYSVVLPNAETEKYSKNLLKITCIRRKVFLAKWSTVKLLQ
jgi:hypothetical protein